MRKIRLTAELIERGATPKGGFTRASLKCLGVGWPPQKGWKNSLIGESVLADDYKAFVTINGGKRVKITKKKIPIDTTRIDEWIHNNKTKKKKRIPTPDKFVSYTIPSEEVAEAIKENEKQAKNE